MRNLVRYVPSGKFFERLRINGRLHRRSLKTSTFSVAKLRLADLEKSERQAAECAVAYEGGKMTFGDALKVFRQRVEGDASLKPRTKEHREERIAVILKTWPGLEKTDVRKLNKHECLGWAANYVSSASNFNKTVQTFRAILDIPVEAGVRYDNPARFIKGMKIRAKPLQLPTRAQFKQMVSSVRAVNKRFSKDAADMMEFLAYGGLRKSEANYVRWSDCDFKREEILVRGDPETGTKNWSVRTIPMIEEMCALLVRLQAAHGEAKADELVLKVSECNGSMANACARLGIPCITHHDLRHLFATTCIEAGVDIPTVSRWLGHKDGGALAIKVYGHLRNEHSQAMAKKVKF